MFDEQDLSSTAAKFGETVNSLIVYSNVYVGSISKKQVIKIGLTGWLLIRLHCLLGFYVYATA